MIYKTIDLCAGIGGIRRGFELTGCFKNVLSAEIDPYACETYKRLFGDDPMNDLTTEEFKKKVDETEYDVLMAGFPCQTFSRIGKKMGFRDTTRGTIFFDIADIISRTNPRAVFLENVENLVSHDGGNTIRTIINTLEEELGYRIIGVTLNDEGDYSFKRSALVRNSKDFGVPQNRPRVYLMAFSKRIYGNAIKLLSENLPEHGTEVVYKDVNDILETDVPDKYYMSQGYLNTLKKHRDRNHAKGNGFGFCVVNGKDREQLIANTVLATGGSGKERNLIYQPKASATGKLIAGRKTPINSEGIRVMTPTEWGRLQGFIGYAFLDGNGVDHFSFPENTTDGQKYKQLGNSVSVPVIKAMAEFMLRCFDILEHQQVEIVRALSQNNPYFTKKDVMELLDLKAFQAGDLLKKMINDKEIIRISRGITTRYTRANNDSELPPYSNEEKVLFLIRESGIVRNKDVVELLNTTNDAVNVLLSGMVKKGLLKRIARGQYCLLDETSI